MDLQEQAQQFRHAYGCVNECANRGRQLALVQEEYREFIESHENFYDYEGGEADCLKELADLVYVCFQYAENLEWDLLEALRRVHESNMTKMGPDGKAIRNPDTGKVLKGPNYKPPHLDDLTNLIC